MALHPKFTSPEEICQVFDSKELKDFHIKMKNILNINNVNYEVNLERSSKDQNGYQIVNKLASTLPNFDLCSAKSITFYTENIAEYINCSFSRIYVDQAFEKIIEIVISCILLHELAHVQQIKEKTLTKEILDFEIKNKYKERPYEIAADLVVTEIMKNSDEFTVKVCQFVNERKCATNEDVEMLIKAFYSHS